MVSGIPRSRPPARRCLRHALAAGPDGKCALCRSESQPPRQKSSWVWAGLLAITLLVPVGALAYRAVASSARAANAGDESSDRTARAVGLEAPSNTLAASTDAPLEVAPPTPAGESIPFREELPLPALPAIVGEETTGPASSAPIGPVAPRRQPPTP